MLKSLALISAFAGITLAQSSSVSSLFLYGFDGGSFVASVVTAAPTMAEFFVQCAPGEDATDCGAGPGVSVTMAPGTYALGINEGEAFTMSETCVIEHGTAVCTVSAGGSEANFPGAETGTLTDVSTEEFFLPVTITAGFDKLAAATGTASSEPTTTGAQSGNSASVTPTPTETESTASNTAQGTSTSTGAAPYVTRNAALAGVAALMGGALMV